jgi:hypothetical protein
MRRFFSTIGHKAQNETYLKPVRFAHSRRKDAKKDFGELKNLAVTVSVIIDQGLSPQKVIV